MNRHSLPSTLLGLVLATGCATTQPPKTLLNARLAYDQAAQGPAAQLNPKDLDTARKQLARAEATFEEEGLGQETDDQAYLALRSAQFADVVGRTTQVDQDKLSIEKAMHSDERKALADRSAELDDAERDVRDARHAGERTSDRLDRSEAELKAEKARRIAAEKLAAQATADLGKLASVKAEPRGVVITLSGSVLFASAKSDLLPAARAKLDSVATALKKSGNGSKFIVEGHTDSRGGDEYNQRLSQSRADAVRNYLISRGIDPQQVVAKGFGSSQSVADNASAEGRANNRRVEIVISPAD
ncbi:MAG: OmpA family protein [Polyangiaceae bacterium]